MQNSAHIKVADTPPRAHDFLRDDALGPCGTRFKARCSGRDAPASGMATVECREARAGSEPKGRKTQHPRAEPA